MKNRHIMLALFLLMTISIIHAYSPLERIYYDEYYVDAFTTDSSLFHSKYYRPNIYGPQIFDYKYGELRSSIIYCGTLNFRLDGEIGIHFSESLFYQTNFRISDNPELLNGYIGPKRESIGEARADILSSSFTYRNEILLVSLNRGRIETSHYGNNLMINSNSYLSDNIIVSIEAKNISVDYIAMFLKSSESLNRSIIYHRYGYSWPSVNIGFSELALIA